MVEKTVKLLPFELERFYLYSKRKAIKILLPNIMPSISTIVMGP